MLIMGESMHACGQEIYRNCVLYTNFSVNLKLLYKNLLNKKKLKEAGSFITA